MTSLERELELLEAIVPHRGDLAWQDDALCAQTDPESHFPGKGETARRAKKTCAGCDVRETCLEYAMSNQEEWGVWGGTSPQERRALAKKRGLPWVGPTYRKHEESAA